MESYDIDNRVLDVEARRGLLYRTLRRWERAPFGPDGRTPAQYIIAMAGLTIAFSALIALATIADEQKPGGAASGARALATSPYQRVTPARPNYIYYIVGSEEQRVLVNERLQARQLTSAAAPGTRAVEEVLIASNAESAAEILLASEQAPGTIIVELRLPTGGVRLP